MNDSPRDRFPELEGIWNQISKIQMKDFGLEEVAKYDLDYGYFEDQLLSYATENLGTITHPQESIEEALTELRIRITGSREPRQ